MWIVSMPPAASAMALTSPAGPAPTTAASAVKRGLTVLLASRTSTLQAVRNNGANGQRAPAQNELFAIATVDNLICKLAAWIRIRLTNHLELRFPQQLLRSMSLLPVARHAHYWLCSPP